MPTDEMQILFKRVTYPKRKKATKKRRPTRKSGNETSQLPELYEPVPPVPVPTGDYLQKFMELKEKAFAVVQARLLDDHPVASVSAVPKFNRPITGYQAFVEYHYGEFYNAPIVTATKCLSEAWRLCSQKNIWEYYAHIFNKHKPPMHFVKWIQNCPKVEMLPLISDFK